MFAFDRRDHDEVVAGLTAPERRAAGSGRDAGPVAAGRPGDGPRRTRRVARLPTRHPNRTRATTSQTDPRCAPPRQLRRRRLPEARAGEDPSKTSIENHSATDTDGMRQRPPRGQAQVEAIVTGHRGRCAATIPGLPRSMPSGRGRRAVRPARTARSEDRRRAARRPRPARATLAGAEDDYLGPGVAHDLAGHFRSAPSPCS